MIYISVLFKGTNSQGESYSCTILTSIGLHGFIDELTDLQEQNYFVNW